MEPNMSVMIFMTGAALLFRRHLREEQWGEFKEFRERIHSVGCPILQLLSAL